jgi:histidine triad (HIT) family protein
MGDCVFCGIVAGELPASRVFEDDQVLAFLDIRPVNPGHLLVVPKAHAEFLADLPPETGARVFEAARRLAAALRACGVRCEGVNLILADGEAAGQEVPHLHLHVIPRWSGDGFGFRHSGTYGRNPDRAELDEIAGRVRSKL